MNHYGLLAQEHWQRHQPSRYQALEDPTAYFTELGETAAAQIEELSASLERTLPADLPYLDRVGQMQAIRKQAEESVLSELVYSAAAETTSLVDELEEMLGQLPTADRLQELLEGLQEEAAKNAELEGRTELIYSDEQIERRQRWTTLLELVSAERTPEQMTEQELRERIEALSPFVATLT